MVGLFRLLVLVVCLRYSIQHGVSSEVLLHNKTSSTMVIRNYDHGNQTNSGTCKSHTECLHGICMMNATDELQCKCDIGWTGKFCEKSSCESKESCVHGTCLERHNCVCHTGWAGYFCNETLKSLPCGEEIHCLNGDCVDGTCICYPAFYGALCDVWNCSQGECGNHGLCKKDRCECDANWSGQYCNVLATPDNCDANFMEWITFQRRLNFDVSFQQNFIDYVNGFGDEYGTGDFWLGLHALHHLTRHGDWNLKINVKDYNGSWHYNEYSGFKILPPPFYNITWTGWIRGDLGNDTGSGKGMDVHQGAPFSTKDRDRDNAASTDCSNYWGRNGWWFNRCHEVYLNADRATSSNVDLSLSRMRWHTVRQDIPLIGSTMKMRLMT